MYILRRSVFRSLASPAVSSAVSSHASTSIVSRSFISLSTPTSSSPSLRQFPVSQSLLRRYLSSNASGPSMEGDNVKVVLEETTDAPPQAQEASQGQEAAASNPRDTDTLQSASRVMRNDDSDAFASQDTDYRQSSRRESSSRGSRNLSNPGQKNLAEQDLPPADTLYVGNLFFEVTEEALREKFAEFGQIKDVRIISDHRGLSKGFGYVTFDSIDSATKAMNALRQTDFMGRNMAINYQVKRTDRPERRPARPTIMNDSAPSKTLFIGNMSYEMSDKDLNDLFRNVKNVVDVRVAIDRNTGQPRGFAHADFQDVQSATLAKEELQGKSVYGRSLKVDFSQSNPRTPSDQRGRRGSRDRHEI